jgi:hypothetical protein
MVEFRSQGAAGNGKYFVRVRAHLDSEMVAMPFGQIAIS